MQTHLMQAHLMMKSTRIMVAVLMLGAVAGIAMASMPIYQEASANDCKKGTPGANTCNFKRGDENCHTNTNEGSNGKVNLVGDCF
jgi:hypothetical protein